MFAKINNDTLIMYPYTKDTLIEENLNSNFDNRYTLIEWYSKTEDAALTGNTIVEIISTINIPTFDPYNEDLTLNDTPTLVDGNWVLDWKKTSKTQEQKQQYIDNLNIVGSTTQ